MIHFKITCTVVFIGLLLMVQNSLATEEVPHDHEHDVHLLSLDAVAIRAIKKIRQLTREDKLEKNWAGKRPESVEKQTVENHELWVATFSDAPSGEKVKIYVSVDGSRMSVDQPIAP